MKTKQGNPRQPAISFMSFISYFFQRDPLVIAIYFRFIGLPNSHHYFSYTTNICLDLHRTHLIFSDQILFQSGYSVFCLISQLRVEVESRRSPCEGSLPMQLLCFMRSTRKDWKNNTNRHQQPFLQFIIRWKLVGERGKQIDEVELVLIMVDLHEI